MAPRHLGLLILGVVAVSFSAILIRLAHAPALSIAFYRNAFAAALLLPAALATRRGEFGSLTRRDVGLALLAGALLAAHFATWIPSLRYISVAASTVLVTSQPVWVALLGWLILRERVSSRTRVGIALSLAGALVIYGRDLGSTDARGDALAIAGAIAAAGYFLSGRSLRRRVSLLTYVGIAYTTCAGLLAIAMLVSGTPFSGFAPKAWLLFALMALVPQILGHTVFNYLLADLEAGVVAIAVTGEPIGASLLAFAFFQEVPPWTAVVGGALILIGIYATISAQDGARDRAVPEVPIE